MSFSIKEILAAFMVLFAIIDIFGSVPIILDIKSKAGEVGSGKASLVAFIIFLLFFFAGEPLLALFGVDIQSFAIAGSLVILLLGLEMVMGIELFKHDAPGGGTIVPIAFPLIAGAGSITTLLSLKAEYETVNILIALTLNMIVVFLVLKLTSTFERLLGPAGIHILRKMFGIILLAIAVKLFITNTGIILPHAS
ncbi:MAG: MarC family protein [Marinilabiliaceae bacterium]|jgi:multiple antibiotic resistance protein|nr:MarC family protein [Marinilabiliaceae bacterium]